MTSCWLWGGSYYPSGYGQAWSPVLKRGTQAHRFVYEQLVGPIPEGLQLDHLCRVIGCVNPDHLRPVTGRNNIMAPGSTCLAKANAAKTHCPRGHEYDAKNTWVSPRDGRRFCRPCKNAHKQKARSNRRISALGVTPSRSAACPSGTEAVALAGTNTSVFQDAARQDAASVSN